MDETFLNDLIPVVDSATQRTRQLIETVVPQLEIDWTTGRVNINDRIAVANAIQTFSGSSTSGELSSRFLALLDDGFAVRPTGPGPEDPAFRPIPWRSLAHAPSVEAMGTQDWEWLGIREGSTVDRVRAALEQFQDPPEYVLSADQVSMLRDSADFLVPLLNASPEPPRRPSGSIGLIGVYDDGVPLERIGAIWHPMMPISRNGGGNGGGEKPPPPPPPPPGPDYVKLAQQIWAFIKEIGECLSSAQWSIEWAWIYPLGVRVCLDAACTERVSNAFKALLGAGAGNLMAAIATMIAKGAFSFAALFSTLGWLGLAMLHFATYWTAMIALNATPRGVCIIHLFPWNCALTAGVVNGWAQGR